MDHEDRGQARRARGDGARQIAADAAVPRWRWHRDPLDVQSRVLRTHLLAPGEIGTQGREQPCGRDAGFGKTLGPIQEAAAVEAAVDIGIEQDQELRVEIAQGGVRGHAGSE